VAEHDRSFARLLIRSFCVASVVGVLAVVLPVASAVAADTTPPSRPVVDDKANYTPALTELRGVWSASDRESGIAEYQYQIREGSTTGVIVVNWTSTGTRAGVLRTGLRLTTGKTYFFAVRARNAARLWSAVGYSDGVVADGTPPPAPAAPLDGGVGENYSSDGTIKISWAASVDRESGVTGYELQEQVGTGPAWTSVGTTHALSASVTGRAHGTLYTYRVRARNGAGTWGPWSEPSDGIRVDKTPPTLVAFTAAAVDAGGKLTASWKPSLDLESGVVEYQYAVLENSSAGRAVVDWTPVRGVTSIALTLPGVVPGRKYVVGARAKNGAGLSSAAAYSASTGSDTTGPTVSVGGFGAQTLGGEGRPIFRVTSLADSGPGTLRDAVSKGGRYIVFDVGGTIELKSAIYVHGAFTTIDGLSAPPPGITLRYHALVLRDGGGYGAHDVIVTGLRVRDTPNNIDCVQVAKAAYNIVLTHLSTSGCGDGNIDVTDGAHDVTVSWSVLADPASDKTMLIMYGAERVTLHHNLFVAALTRNPQISREGSPASTETTVDMRNNVVWGWGPGYGTLVRYGASVNVVNNYFGNPTGAKNDQAQALMICRGDGRETPASIGYCGKGEPASASRGYVKGNVSYDGVALDLVGTVTAPLAAPTLPDEDACTAATRVVAEAGALPRDDLDNRYVPLVSLGVCPRR
jgi:pectate lyase